MRLYELPLDLEKKIIEFLKEKNHEISKPSSIAESILKLSEFYIQNPSRATPWNETWAQVGYVSYFLPLNYLRIKHVFSEVQRFGFFKSLNSLLDWGSGPGTVSLVARDFGFQKIINYDQSTLPQEIHKQYFHGSCDEWASSPSWNPNHQLGVFSYSLTEALPSFSHLLHSQALIFIEPSTRQDGRALLELRQKLLENGFHAWAPCPHQKNCPLLTASKKDWCHDRIFFAAPQWFLEIEKSLPMKNQNLTLSYLALQKNPPPHDSNLVRIVGDQLDEKGKHRQMICSGEQRQFLSWLKRNQKTPDWRRGDLLTITGLNQTLNEVRVSPDLQIRSAWEDDNK